MEILPMLGAILIAFLILMYFFTPSRQKLTREAEEQRRHERNDEVLKQLRSEHQRTSRLLEEMSKKR